MPEAQGRRQKPGLCQRRGGEDGRGAHRASPTRPRAPLRRRCCVPGLSGRSRQNAGLPARCAREPGRPDRGLRDLHLLLLLVHGLALVFQEGREDAGVIVDLHDDVVGGLYVVEAVVAHEAHGGRPLGELEQQLHAFVAAGQHVEGVHEGVELLLAHRAGARQGDPDLRQTRRLVALHLAHCVQGRQTQLAAHDDAPLPKRLLQLRRHHLEGLRHRGGPRRPVAGIGVALGQKQIEHQHEAAVFTGVRGGVQAGEQDLQEGEDLLPTDHGLAHGPRDTPEAPRRSGHQHRQTSGAPKLRREEQVTERCGSQLLLELKALRLRSDERRHRSGPQDLGDAKPAPEGAGQLLPLVGGRGKQVDARLASLLRGAALMEEASFMSDASPELRLQALGVPIGLVGARLFLHAFHAAVKEGQPLITVGAGMRRFLIVAFGLLAAGGVRVAEHDPGQRQHPRLRQIRRDEAGGVRGLSRAGSAEAQLRPALGVDLDERLGVRNALAGHQLEAHRRRSVQPIGLVASFEEHRERFAQPRLDVSMDLKSLHRGVDALHRVA
eukprot:scaffold149_cov315-Pinguiococcus_pyrenoidosus.AAC.139